MPKVYPVAGYYISNVPHIPHDCDGKDAHTLCLASGAFTKDPPPADEPTETPDEPGSLDVEDK